MQPINILTSTAVPLPLPNIDTDQIIPKQFLKRIERTGYGDFLFFDWRYNLDMPDHVEPRRDFVLNKPEYKGAEILIAEKNFGCGSSREHAAWAINQYGFRAVIAPTFADIFFSNAGKNGIILAALTDAEVETLIQRSTANPEAPHHHQPRSPDRHRRAGLPRALRHRPVPQVLPAERPRRHRPHPPPRRRTRQLRIQTRRRILVRTQGQRSRECLRTKGKQLKATAQANARAEQRISPQAKQTPSSSPKAPRAPPRAATSAPSASRKEDLHKPIIGIANTWTEIGPCNFHLRQVAEAVKEGIREAGGTPMEFNTITIHDGITMGTEGMKASLISREVIADSIELVTRANSFDGLVCIAGCDKNMPAAIMALARLNIPGLMLYGGSIAPGNLRQPDGTNKEITILPSSKPSARTLPERSTTTSSKPSKPQPAPAPEPAAASSPPTPWPWPASSSASRPSSSPASPPCRQEKHAASREAGRMVMELARKQIKPRDILTREAIENAIAAVAASGGSTNAVLHLIAIAHELNIPLTMEDFDRISERTPFICDLSPGGKYAAKDYQDAGGSRLLAAAPEKRTAR